LHAHFFFPQKIKTLDFEKYKVKGQIWRPWKHNCAEHIGVIDLWKGYFIIFEMSIQWALYLNSGRSYATFSKTTCVKRSFLTILDVCSQKSSGHKAVKFGRITYLHWDYNLTKNHSILRDSGWECLFSVWIWCVMTWLWSCSFFWTGSGRSFLCLWHWRHCAKTQGVETKDATCWTTLW
jgi:hypothetical protein